MDDELKPIGIGTIYNTYEYFKNSKTFKIMKEIQANQRLFLLHYKNHLKISNEELVRVVDMLIARDEQTYLTALDIIAQLDYADYSFVLAFIFANRNCLHNLRTIPSIVNENTLEIAAFWEGSGSGFNSFIDAIEAPKRTLLWIADTTRPLVTETSLSIFEYMIHNSQLYTKFRASPIDHKSIRFRRD